MERIDVEVKLTARRERHLLNHTHAQKRQERDSRAEKYNSGGIANRLDLP